MPTLPFHRLEVDTPNSRVKVRPSSTFDVTDPGDDFPTPAWWEGRVRFDAGRVYLATRMARIVFTCNSGVDNYTLQSGTGGIASGGLTDIDVTRQGHTVVFDPVLTSTNGREYVFELAGYSGDARALTAAHFGFAAPFGVLTVQFGLFQGASLVAPTVGGTYTVDVISYPTLPAP